MVKSQFIHPRESFKEIPVTPGEFSMKNFPFKNSSAEKLGREAGRYFGSKAVNQDYKDWHDFAQKRFGYLDSLNPEPFSAQQEKTNWFFPRPKTWEDYGRESKHPRYQNEAVSYVQPIESESFAAKLGREAGERASSDAMWNNTDAWENAMKRWYDETVPNASDHSSPAFESDESFEALLDQIAKNAPKPSPDGRIRCEMKPESAWTKWENPYAQPQSNEDSIWAKALRRSVNTLHYIGDVADDWYFRGLTYGGKRMGYSAGNALAEATDMQPTDWEYDELFGGIHKRVPIEDRGWKAYLEACERGEDPSKWYAHAEDADFLYDWNPDNMVSAVAKGAIAGLLNATAPSQLAKGYLLEGLNGKLIKIPKKPHSQLKVKRTLEAVEPFADMIYQRMK